MYVYFLAGHLTYISVSAYTHIGMHAHMHAHALTCPHTCMLIHTHTRHDTHVCACMHACTHACTHTHTRTHARMHAHTHTHTHVHTFLIQSWYVFCKWFIFVRNIELLSVPTKKKTTITAKTQDSVYGCRDNLFSLDPIQHRELFRSDKQGQLSTQRVCPNLNGVRSNVI